MRQADRKHAMQAAICGDLAILDGVHRLAKAGFRAESEWHCSDTLIAVSCFCQGSLYATLAPLLSDRACALPDGTPPPKLTKL